ncbi:MAG: TMF family protein [Candidatus Methanofastidiosa archaeon]|nr:TMF family protein [Candidatus Methanofastidiosa archaeon]
MDVTKKKSIIFILFLILGALAINIQKTNAQGFAYSFNILSQSTDIAASAKVDIMADVDISEDYIILNNQIYLSNSPQTIVIDTSIPKSSVNQIQFLYQDANSSWKEFPITLDTNSTNARFTLDTTGKNSLDGYNFILNYRLNTASIYTIGANVNNSFDYSLLTKIGDDDIASLTVTLPENYKPLNTAGWRLEEERFSYTTQITKSYPNFYTIFYKEKDVSVSIDSLKQEITKLRDDNSKLSERILDLQKSVESYKTENQELTNEIENLNKRLQKAEEDRIVSERISNNFWQFSWGLTILLPILLLFFAELRTKSVITSTQLLISSVVGTFVVFLILYILFIT